MGPPTRTETPTHEIIRKQTMAVELYDEHEQSERVRGWLRENGAALLIGVGLALAGIFGFRQWQDYQSSRDVLASEYYTQVQVAIDDDRLVDAQTQFGRMEADVSGHAYVDLAAMLLAGAEVDAGETLTATDRYDALLERNSGTALEPLIRIRLARLQGASGQGEQGLGLLNGGAPIGFESLWLETRADLYAELGRTEDAIAAYSAAAEQLRGEGNSARVVEIKLDALRSSSGSAAGSTEAS